MTDVGSFLAHFLMVRAINCSLTELMDFSTDTGAWGIAQWYSDCPACTKTWVRSPHHKQNNDTTNKQKIVLTSWWQAEKFSS
jgi:hypothetical protein